MPPDLNRASLAFIPGSGTSNRRPFDCIIAHLPTD